MLPTAEDVVVPAGVRLWLSEREGQAGPYVSLDQIRVAPDLRRHGVGSRVMRDLCAWADRNDVLIALTPGDEFGTSKAFLRRWYRSFGFIPNKGARADLSISGVMIRRPNKKGVR